ncbi:hypothetical protein C8R47DRAFT_1217702 [Mycena vitilis]|nr:hypothetical protein C8R47DRAFT_1217702 [Mycena vitilis]
MRINDETVLVDAPIYGSTSHHRSLPQPPHASGSAAPPLRPQFVNPPHTQNLPFPNLSSPRRHSRRSRTPDLMEDTEGQFMGQLTSSDEDDFTSSSESQHRSPRMKSAVPLFGSSNRTVLDMPLRGSRDAPKTFRGHHSEVEYFIAHYDRLLVKFHVNDPEDQCRLILDYCATDVQGFIRASKYFQQNRWPKLRIEILQCYDADKAISRYKPSDIATYTLRTKSRPFQNLSQWKKYYIKYKTMAGILLQQGHITQVNYDVYFWLGIEQDLRRTLEQRINQLNPSRNVHRQYSVREINIAAEWFFRRNRAEAMVVNAADYGVDLDSGTSDAETEDESDIDSDDSDYENYRRKHRAKARAKKEKEKKKKKKTANAPTSGKSRIVSTSGTAEEVTSLIRQLNKMTITDPEYAPVYYRVLTLDTTGVAAKCVQPPRLPQPWQERPSQKGNQAPTPTTGATGGSSGAPGPTTYPNNIPVPTGCYGCGLDGHRIGECSEIRELKAKNVIKVDETTRRVRMGDGTYIHRQAGESLAAAARRQAAPRVMYTSARQYAASDSDESSAAFIEDYPAAVDTSDIESEVEYREDMELDAHWYVADSDYEVRDCQKTPGDVYLTVPGPIVELEPDEACVNAAERTLPSTRVARRDIFDGVMLPRRERAKNDPEPVKASPAPQESTRNKKEQAPRQVKDLLPELTPVDARMPRDDVDMPDLEVVAKRGNPSPSSDKGPTKENNDPQKAKHQMENPSKNTGRYSDLQAGVQIPSIVDRILDLTIPLTVREVFVASKEVRSGIMDVMHFKNIKAVLLGKSEDNPIVAHWGWPRTEGVLIKIDVLSHGRLISAIIDTGSQLNVVRADIAALRIQRPVDMTMVTNMNDANGGKGQLRGYIRDAEFGFSLADALPKFTKTTRFEASNTTRPHKTERTRTATFEIPKDISNRVSKNSRNSSREGPELAFCWGFPCITVLAILCTFLLWKAQNGGPAGSYRACLGEHYAASYKGRLNDNVPVIFALPYETPPTQTPQMTSRSPSPPASFPHHLPSPKNESPTDATQDEVRRFLATIHVPPSPTVSIPSDVLSRTRTHHFGRVDTHPRSGTNHQRVQAATDLQWAAFRRGHELTVRPGSVVSPQTVYTGREVRSNGQEVHHAVLLNARLLVHNPDSGEPGMQNGHAMVHFYTAPRADVAWDLETPYAPAESVHRQLKGYSAAIHQEVGRQRRTGNFAINGARQIKEINAPPPPTPASRAMSSPRRPISPLAKLLPARLPLRRSGEDTPPDLTYPARTPPRTRPANSLSTNYIEVDTGNRVLALPTNAHPHLDASPRPGTPGLPGRLHEGRPRLRRAHSSDDAMEDVLPAPPAPSAPSASAEQVAAPVPRPPALTKERINKLNAEALRRAIERRVGLASGVPMIEQEQAAAVESDGESLGSTDTWSVSSSDEDDPMGGASAKENAAVLAVDGGHDDNGHEGETQDGRTGPESRAERSRAGKRLPFGAANTGPGTGPQGDASRRHPTFSSTSIPFPPPSFSPSPPSLSPPPAPRLRTIPLPSASASEAESGDYFSIDHHRDDYDHRDDRDPRSPSSGRRSTLLTPDRPLFTTEPLASAASSTSSLLSSLSTSLPSLISFRSGPSAFHFVLQDELKPQPAATTKNVSDRGELQLSQRSPAGHAIVDEPLLNFNISCVWDGIPSAVFEPTEMTLDLPRMRRIIARHDATIARRRQDQNTKVKAVIERAVQAYDYCAPYLDFDAMDRAEMVVIDTYQHVPTKRKTWQEVQERVDHEEVMKKFLATISTDCGDGTRRVRDDLGVPVSEDGDRVRALSVAAMLNGAMYRLAILLFAQPRLMEIARVAALRARVLHVTFECDALADTRGIAYDETLLHQPAPFPPPFLHGIEYMHLRLLMYMFAREGDFEISDGIAQILKYRLREPAVITHFLCAGLLDPNDTVVREGVANDTWNAPSSVFNSLV